jgi:hypothetical protein
VRSRVRCGSVVAAAAAAAPAIAASSVPLLSLPLLTLLSSLLPFIAIAFVIAIHP